MSRAPSIALSVCIIVVCLAIALNPSASFALNPTLTSYKEAERSSVSPGDTLNYSVYFDNSGPQVSPIVWINDTLPSKTAYLNDTAYLLYGPTSGYFRSSNLTGNVLRVRFSSVPVGNHTFVIRVRILTTARDGDVLVNSAVMNYTSNSGKSQPGVVMTSSVTVRTPVMQISMTAEQDPGDPAKVNYSVTIANIGSVESLHVILDDNLPLGIGYLSYQAPPGATCSEISPGVVRCNRDHFAPGSELWKILTSVGVAVPPESTVANRVFLNATDQDGTPLQTISTDASFVSQSARIDVVKLVDLRRAMPGTNINYFIYYNNTGGIAARNVWINDTLPVGVTVVGASPTPVLNSSGNINWYMTDVSVGAHAVNVEAHLATSLANGTGLNNQVSVDYFDALGRKRPQSSDSATTIVNFDLPSIGVVIIASRAEVGPGGQADYQVFYNNTGTTGANTVTIQGVIPVGTRILSANPAYTSYSGNRYFWDFQNVPIGDHYISITIGVDIGVSTGTALVTAVYLSYTDEYNQVVGSSFDSAVVTVVATHPGDGGQGGIDPRVLIVLGAVIFLVTLVGFRIYTIRRGGEAVIDDVFLLHKDGLLIRHFTRKLNPEVDSDILGGMLIAVQNFVNESFASDRGLAKEGGLDALQFGKYSILLARGKHVVVAAVVSGKRTESVVSGIRMAIDDLEKEIGSVLERWSGDMAEVTGADKYIQDLMAGKYGTRKKST